MSLLKVGVETETDREFIDSFFEVFYTTVANSPEIEVFREVFFSLFYATVNVINGLLPVLKIEVNDGSVVEQVRTAWVEFVPDLHFLQGLDQDLCLFHLILSLGDVEPIYVNHGDVDVRLYFLRVDLFGFVELRYRFIEIMFFIRKFHPFSE